MLSSSERFHVRAAITRALEQHAADRAKELSAQRAGLEGRLHYIREELCERIIDEVLAAVEATQKRPVSPVGPGRC